MENTPSSIREIEKTKVEKVMNTVAWRAGYYRENPHRFVKDCIFLGNSKFKLTQFQSILIWCMFHNNYFMMIASRGLGKTWLLGLFAHLRCILFPGTKVIVTAGTLKQANEVLLKIQDEFLPESPFSRNEILYCKIGQNDATIMYKNGSWIKSRTSTENARSARANVIIDDEFRMQDRKIVDSVIREFLKAPRRPPYLNNPQYKNLKERNVEVYATSAWYKSSWAQEKVKSYAQNSLDDRRKYFLCGLPYQVSIRDGLLMPEQVEDTMSERDFDPISFSINFVLIKLIEPLTKGVEHNVLLMGEL